jgi:type VI secretion system protein
MKQNRYFHLPPISLVHRVLLLGLSLLLTASQVSCGMGKRTRAMFGEKLDIKVYISEKANQNSPIAFDVVLVYDEGLLERLLSMPSREWFEKKEQIKRDYLQGEGLDFWGWEWVPGQEVPVQSLPFKTNAVGGFIFADYFTPGSHRFRIDPFKDISVRLLEKGFTVEPGE